MSEPKSVEVAEEVAKEIFGRLVMPTFAEFDSRMKAFAAVVFEVPATPEADGFLFQYGKVNWLTTPMFILGITRQLAMSESYLQVNFEYRYDVSVSSDSDDEWWFTDDGRSFSEWYESVREKPIWRHLAEVEPVEFSIAQDVV